RPTSNENKAPVKKYGNAKMFLLLTVLWTYILMQVTQEFRNAYVEKLKMDLIPLVREWKNK
ncbi:MAG TPA: hypothetical protein PK515_03345, partial [Candidatus Cloacimonas sp.]|nr:hypothetical protein [Candidatus Cloacimonas sp.]